MKTTLAIILSLTCIPSVSYADTKNLVQPDTVVVKVLEKPLPSGDADKENFLVDSFFGKPDNIKFNSYTRDNWNPTFKIFAEALVKKADDQKLDSKSLRMALDLILKDATENNSVPMDANRKNLIPMDAKRKIVYLPIGAYQTTLDDKLVWIVTAKWAGLGEGGLSHIVAIAFDQKTMKIVGLASCG